MKKIGIIGGGLAGLASACRLQKAGYDVSVFEKNDTLGGRMNIIEGNGYKFDLGPTIVMMPDIYKSVFSDCGEDPSKYIPMFELKTLFDLYIDNVLIKFPSSLNAIHSLLEEIEPNSASGFLEYLSVIYKRFIIARDHFITKSFRKPSDFYNLKTLKNGLKLRTFDSADNFISKYVKNDLIKKMLAFQTLYIGISPYQGPSLYSIIPMIEMVYGVWFIKGGMRSMADGMIELGKSLGVQYYTNENVEEILISDSNAYGFISNGVKNYFDIVLNTSDFPYAMNNLIKEKKHKGKYTPKKIDKMDYSCSGYLLYLGINKDLSDKVSTHNVIFSNDFEKNISDIFEGEFPEDPSIYVYVPSTVDSSLAPENKSCVYVLTPVPELKTGDLDWQDEKVINNFRQSVIEKLKTIEDLEDIENHIEFETSITPLDFKNKFNAQFGSAFGLRPTLAQSNYYRPQAALRNISNLYFAGASNHPGAGVPIVLTSAELVVKEIIKDDKNTNGRL